MPATPKADEERAVALEVAASIQLRRVPTPKSADGVDVEDAPTEAIIAELARKGRWPGSLIGSGPESTPEPAPAELAAPPADAPAEGGTDA